MTRVLIPSGALGLGYDPDALMAGLANEPDVIAIDGGSTDSGPPYIGHGMSKYSASSTRAEWRGLMQARAGRSAADHARQFSVPADSIKRFDIGSLNVVKFSLPRPVVQGTRRDRDIHGAQWANLLAELTLAD
jgi:uncharacterized protein DUF4387